MTDYYKLDENNIVQPSSLDEYKTFVHDKPPYAHKQGFKTSIDDWWVSTIFMGIDHNFYDTLRPIVFETMVFHKKDIPLNYQVRYTTYSESEEGHAKAVQWVRDGCKDE